HLLLLLLRLHLRLHQHLLLLLLCFHLRFHHLLLLLLRLHLRLHHLGHHLLLLLLQLLYDPPQDRFCLIRLLYCTCLFLGFVRRTACIIILLVLFLVPINSPRRTRRTDLTRLLLRTDLTFVASRPLSFLSSFRSLPCRNCRVRWLTGHRTSLITRRGVETKCSRGRAKSEQGEKTKTESFTVAPVIRHDRSSAPRMTYHG